MEYEDMSLELFTAVLTADDDALRNIVAINRSLSKIFGGNKFNMAAWLTAENKDFEGMQPVEVMLDSARGMRAVREYLEQARDRGV